MVLFHHIPLDIISAAFFSSLLVLLQFEFLTFSVFTRVDIFYSKLFFAFINARNDHVYEQGSCEGCAVCVGVTVTVTYRDVKHQITST